MVRLTLSRRFSFSVNVKVAYVITSTVRVHSRLSLWKWEILDRRLDPELLDNLERQFLNPEIFESSFSSRDF